MNNNIDWIIHLVANGACDECGKEEKGFLPYTCNAHTHGMEKYDHPDFQVVLSLPPREIGRIVRLKPRGSIKRCPLLRDRKCSVHNAKPTVCALFPLGRSIKLDAKETDPNAIERARIQYIINSIECGDRSEEHTVREWVESFGIPIHDNDFIALELHKYDSRVMRMRILLLIFSTASDGANMEPFFDAKIWVKPKWSHPLKEEVKHQWKRERCPGRSFWAPVLTVETTTSLILKGLLRLRWSANAGTRTVSSWFIWTLMMEERSSLPRGRTLTTRASRMFLLIPASELLSSIPRKAFLILEVPK